MSPARWNHNIHHHKVVLAAVPDGARTSLDVGCGEGALARELSEVVEQVTAIDTDEASVAAVRRADPTGRVDVVHGDALTYPFEPESFDLVTAVASLHHLDEAAALARMRDLLRPGGRLAVVACARSRLPHDLAWEAAAVVSHRAHLLRRTWWDHPSPTCWPPPHTYDELRELATRVLPGVRFRRHVLWRCSLFWTKPLSGS